MNTIEAAINRYSDSFMEEGREVRKECVDLIVRYLFRAINYADLKKELKGSVEDIDVTGLRDFVTNKGYLLKNFKLWLFACVKRGTTSTNKSMRRDYKIEECDRNISTMLSNKTTRYIKALGRKYDPWTLKEVEKAMNVIIADTNVWVRKFVNKKMHFIIRNTQNSVTLNDLHQELLVKGFRGLYLMFPMIETPEHAMNIVKRTIHNQGINLIQSYTTQKRAVTLRNVGLATFYSNTISLDAFAPAERSAALEVMVEDIRSQDLSIDIRKFVEGLKFEKQKTLVKLLMGSENQKFYDYLKQERLLRRYDSLPTQDFIGVCFKYLEVPKEQGWRFVQRMQLYFEAYQSSAMDHLKTFSVPKLGYSGYEVPTNRVEVHV